MDGALSRTGMERVLPCVGRGTELRALVPRPAWRSSVVPPTVDELRSRFNWRGREQLVPLAATRTK